MRWYKTAYVSEPAKDVISEIQQIVAGNPATEWRVDDGSFSGKGFGADVKSLIAYVSQTQFDTGPGGQGAPEYEIVPSGDEMVVKIRSFSTEKAREATQEAVYPKGDRFRHMGD